MEDTDTTTTIAAADKQDETNITISVPPENKNDHDDNDTSSIVDGSNNHDDDGNRTTTAPPTTHNKRRARFGSVRVAWHRMTLGNNPGGTTSGPPVMLDWEKQRSQRFDSVDGYSREFHRTVIAGTGLNDDDDDNNNTRTTTKRPVYRMSRRQRQEIALQHHTESEITLIEREIISIRQSRLQSSQEPDEDTVKGMLQKKKNDNKQQKQNSSGGLFSSCFGR